MRYITFNKKLSEADRNWPSFKFGRVVVDESGPKTQVYNSEKDVIDVKSFNVPPEFPFDTEFSYARIYINSHTKRASVHLIYKNPREGSSYTGCLLSRYVYKVNHKTIPDGHDVDHIDGNKFNDRLSNLTVISSEHNFLKTSYGYHWLTHYNESRGTNFVESDLLDINLLNDLIAYVEVVRPNVRKELNGEYYRLNADKLKKEAKEYRLRNIDRVKQRDRDYHQRNKEHRNAQKRDYRAKRQEELKVQSRERYQKNKDIYKERRQQYNEANKEAVKESLKRYREENAEFIKAKKSLFGKLDKLVVKPWTPEIGNRILEILAQIFELYGVTLDELRNGVDGTKYKTQVIAMFHRLRLLYSEQLNRLSPL